MKDAFLKSIPIMCSYLFVSMAYGMMMENAGYHWYYSFLASMTIYTGAFQFVLITFLSSGASVITIMITAFLMNSRQAFYSLSFLDVFRDMGKRKLYMIHTMTDETYAVNCSIGNTESKKDIMFFVAIFSRCYWMIGAVLGGVIGQLLPFLIFRNDNDIPDMIKRLGEILPSAIMAILIVYCLKDAGNNFIADGIWRLVAVLIVVVSYKWKHSTLLSILLGTVSYMLLLHI